MYEIKVNQWNWTDIAVMLACMQVVYASLDAAVLVRLFDVLVPFNVLLKVFLAQWLSFEELGYAFMFHCYMCYTRMTG